MEAVESLNETCHVKTAIGKNQKRTKAKTVPSNSYLQFVKFKKKEAAENNLEGKLDLLEVQKEWSRMEDDRKSYFQECYQKEKVEMGPNYRLNYKTKRKPNRETTRKKTNTIKPGVTSEVDD